MATIIASAGGVGHFLSGEGQQPTAGLRPLPRVTIGEAGRLARNQSLSDCAYLGNVTGEPCQSATWPLGEGPYSNTPYHVQWWETGKIYIGGGLVYSYKIGIGPNGGVLYNSYSQPALHEPR